MRSKLFEQWVSRKATRTDATHCRKTLWSKEKCQVRPRVTAYLVLDYLHTIYGENCGSSSIVLVLFSTKPLPGINTCVHPTNPRTMHAVGIVTYDPIPTFPLRSAHVVQPDVFSFNTAITACVYASNWRQALDLLASMELEGVKPNIYSYNSAISACARGGQWRVGLELLAKVLIFFSKTFERRFLRHHWPVRCMVLYTVCFMDVKSFENTVWRLFCSWYMVGSIFWSGSFFLYCSYCNGRGQVFIKIWASAFWR